MRRIEGPMVLAILLKDLKGIQSKQLMQIVSEAYMYHL